jgi:Sulfotransferase domain
LSAVEQQPSGTTPASPLGYPDIVLPGAARSGTTFLAARLSRHPSIDGGAVKEPDFFSKHLSRGADWYDGLFESRRDGLLRLDASMSYTVPQHPEALNRLAAAAPHAYVIYAVRDPLVRAVSHYRLLREYFHLDKHTDFGSAIRENPVYLGTSDYSHWLPQLYAHWPKERVLVAPFAITTRGNELPDLIFDQLGLERVALDAETAQRHQNEVVTFRNETLRKLRKSVVRAGAYPLVRRTLGPDRMRRLRARMTRRADSLSAEQALQSCSPEQRSEIEALVERSKAAVSEVLVEQDARLGLDWNSVWLSSFREPQAPLTS